jgi:hypothetical protein
LNRRLINFLEDKKIIHDEQNGFRPGRSCVDHIFALTSIIRNKINENRTVYVTFIDFQKAFDCINRELMLYKILSYGIDGNFYQSVKSLYTKNTASVNINNHLTDWFNTKSGVRQGDCLSPTLFNLFINDLILEIKVLHKGVNFANDNISILLYADDVAVIAENPFDMQSMLNRIYTWCNKWSLNINFNKSNIIHFRKPRSKRSEYCFRLGQNIIRYKDEYKYLGVLLNEHGKFDLTIEELSKASGRALGALISKFRLSNDMGFKAYQKLYTSCVVPVMDYSCEIWGFKENVKCNNVQNRAIQFYLGVNKYTPIAGLYSETGWLTCQERHWIARCRYWNRMINMRNERLLKRIFEYDIQKSLNNWSSEMK